MFFDDTYMYFGAQPKLLDEANLPGCISDPIKRTKTWQKEQEVGQKSTECLHFTLLGTKAGCGATIHYMMYCRLQAGSRAKVESS